MIAVIFEAWPLEDRYDQYLDLAAQLKPLLSTIDGFISIERFQSMVEPGKVLSLSFWRDESSIAQWRSIEQHRSVQTAGRDRIFRDYRLRVAHVDRDYGLSAREQAPADSRREHG